MTKPESIKIGEDRVIALTRKPGNAFYRIKPVYPDFYFTFDEIVKILEALPFSFSIQPLNYNYFENKFDDKDPRRHLVEVFPRACRIISIYAPNFRMIESVHAYGSSELNLKPSIIMDDMEGGFRCSYFPTLKDMGLENKVIPPGPCRPRIDVENVEIDIHKFSENDGRRICKYIQTLKDDSEEARMHSRLTQILNDRKYLS